MKLKIITKLKYYQNLCKLLEDVEKENPCDPDITDEQIKANKSI